MEITNNQLALISFVNNDMFLVYIGVFFVLMYLLISLLTWSFLKPLKYLGIPTLCVGVFLIIINFLSKTMINLIDIKIEFIKTILPSLTKPVLVEGIICTLIGIIMIVLYKCIDRKKKEDKEI